LFAPLIHKPLSCWIIIALVAGFILNSGVRCWSFFAIVLTKALMQKKSNQFKNLLVTTRSINEENSDVIPMTFPSSLKTLEK
jgi:hypothetical protein